MVIAPMHQYSAHQGYAGDWHLMNVGRYAAGGAGLVFVESTKVLRNGCGTVGDLALWNDDFIPGLKRLADFIKSCGSAAAIQLGHSGRKARRTRPWEGDRPLTGAEADVFDWSDWQLIAPSALPADDRSPVPEAIATADLAGIIDAFASSAERAEACGFDVLEIHAAHGYLLHQFLSTASNTRTDQYGGSLHNRMRLTLEVTEAVRRVWPSHKPLFVRLSCEDWAGWSLDDSVVLASQLKSVGVDVVDCSAGGMIWPPKSVAANFGNPGYQVHYAQRIRREAAVLTMAVGNIVTGKQANEILTTGGADLTAVAREAMNNPNWAIDAAHDLGLDPDFESLPFAYGFWLEKQASRRFENRRSIFEAGDWRSEQADQKSDA